MGFFEKTYLQYMTSCPACGRINTVETGTRFPIEPSRFVRYCRQLKVDPRKADKKALICLEHFDSRDILKNNDKVVGVRRTALPNRILIDRKDMSNQNQLTANNYGGSGPTLDQLLAQNIGITMPTPASTPSTSDSPGIFDFSHGNTQMFTAWGRGTTTTNGGFQQNVTGYLPFSSQALITPYPSPASSKFNKLADLANRTLVISRRKRSGSSPSLDQKYFREWLVNAFNLPIAAICDQSQILHLQQDFSFIFMLLDEIKTIETIMTMYKAASPNTYQCMLTPANTVLMEGSSILKMKKCGAANVTNLEESFTLLLEPKPGNEDYWQSIAAEMLPVYRMIAASTSQQNQVPNFAASMDSTSNIQPTISSLIQQFGHFTQQHSHTHNKPA